MSPPLNASEPSRVSRRKKLFLKENTMPNTTERKDVYSRITSQIVQYLEKGVRPWARPWNASMQPGELRGPSPQRTALLRNQCSLPLDVRFGPEFYGTDLDDLSHPENGL
jgi:hypothetical protein